MKVLLLARVPRLYVWSGNSLLSRLLESNHDVVGVIVERVSLRAYLATVRHKLGVPVMLRRGIEMTLRAIHRTRPTATRDRPSPAPAIADLTPTVHFVDQHNSADCHSLARKLQPDVIVLMGTGIVRAALLEIPRIATINAHYGTLPEYRGVDVTEWAVLHGDPIVVTVHRVDAGVDTGAVLGTRRVEVEPGATVGVLRARSAAVAVDLLMDALANLDEGTTTPRKQDPTAGRLYWRMHPRLRRLTEERLRRVSGGER